MYASGSLKLPLEVLPSHLAQTSCSLITGEKKEVTLETHHSTIQDTKPSIWELQAEIYKKIEKKKYQSSLEKTETGFLAMLQPWIDPHCLEYCFLHTILTKKHQKMMTGLESASEDARKNSETTTFKPPSNRCRKVLFSLKDSLRDQAPASPMAQSVCQLTDMRNRTRQRPHHRENRSPYCTSPRKLTKCSYTRLSPHNERLCHQIGFLQHTKARVKTMTTQRKLSTSTRP